MATGLYTHWDIDSETSKFTPQQNNTRSFEINVMFFFNVQDLILKVRASKLKAGRRKLISSLLMGCFYHFCPCQELRPSLTEEDVKRVSTKKELDELRRGYIQENGFAVIEKWECERWSIHETTTNGKLHIRGNFPYRWSLTEQQLLEGIKKGNLFGYVQCDIEVPENLRANVANFPLVFKNTLVSKIDIGDLMITYAEEEEIMSQPRKQLISCFTLQNGTLITPLLLFYLQLGIVVTKIHRFVEYSPKNVSTAFYRQQWTQEGKVTKIPTQVSLRRLWNC